MVGGEKAGAGKTLLDTYAFDIPTLDTLHREKKVDKLTAKRQKDLKVLADRHQKVSASVFVVRKAAWQKIVEIGNE